MFDLLLSYYWDSIILAELHTITVFEIENALGKNVSKFISETIKSVFWLFDLNVLSFLYKFIQIYSKISKYLLFNLI